MHSSPPSNVVVSPTGILHVLGYTPTEGELGVPITVRIHFHPDLADAIFVRLVIGHKAVATTVKELSGVNYGRWQLDALAPPFDQVNAASPKVRIAVQALNQDNAIIDSVTFGEFSYWAPPSGSSTSSSTNITDMQFPNHSSGPTLRRRSAAHLPTPSPTFSHRTPRSSKPKDRSTRLARRTKSQALMRSKHYGNGTEEQYAQTPLLDLVTPLGNICTGWTPSEMHCGRRLVRFGKVQEGRRIIVSCESIRPEDYNEADSVISCIYRSESKSCFVTSVDIIYLLERLTNDEFPVEEKNRIRRNLEGLRPITVSKHKAGFEDFFQRIMEFPDPKPRNIEKDLKVFEWTSLGQALEKILSKYSIYSNTSPVDSSDSDELSPKTLPDEPDLALHYAPQSEGQPSFSNNSHLPTKYELPPDDISFLHSSDGSESFSPTVPSNATPVSYPGFTGFHPRNDAEAINNWENTTDFNLDAAYSSLNPYEGIDNGLVETYTNPSAYGFTSFDSLNYSVGDDQSLAGVSKHFEAV